MALLPIPLTRRALAFPGSINLEPRVCDELSKQLKQAQGEAEEEVKMK